MRLNSLRFKYAALSAALFAVGFAAAGVLSRFVVEKATKLAIQREVLGSQELALEAVKEIQARMQTYAELISRKPALAAIIDKGSDMERVSYMTNEFSLLKQLDPAVSVMEATNLIGIVLARGHNPAQFGDDKSKLKEVISATDGKSVRGLAVSPSSGQASFNAVVPVKTSRGAVGTLTIGARSTDAFVQQIKERSSTEIVTLFKGKVTSSTLGKDIVIPVPEAAKDAASLEKPLMAEFDIGNHRYATQFSHVPSFAGEGIVIGTLVDKAPFQNRIAEFDKSLMQYGLMALPFVLAIGFFLGYLNARPIEQMSRALGGLAVGTATSLGRLSRTGDEVGDMARSYSALAGTVEEAFKLRQMVETMPLGVLSATKSNGYQIDYANPALLQRLSQSDIELPYPGQEIVGRSVFELLKSSGATPSAFDGIGPNGLRLRFAAGSATFMVNISPTLANDGTPTGIMAAFEDVSERLRLSNTFERAVLTVAEGVSTAATKLQGQASAVHDVVGDAQERAAVVARAAEESATSVTTVASAADQLLASVEDIRNQMITSTEIIGQADAEAQHVSTVMRDLTEVSHKIGSVVQMIGSIAAQTNLLALNATIEAARAGEAGRGFAVVASEVKTLATQTSRAAEDVVELVRAVQSRTEIASVAINRIAGTIGQISAISVGIGAAVEQQSRATDEIARSTQSTAQSTNEVASSITAVSNASMQAEGETNEMLGQVQVLQSTISTLREEVDDFLTRLAA